MKKLLFAPVVFCLVLTACGSPSEEDQILQVQEYSKIMQTGKDLVDPVHGKEVKFYYGAVSGANGTNANGLAYVHVFEDGTSIVTVNLNIELSRRGTRYVAYLNNSTGDLPVKIGELKSIVGDVRHTMKNETQKSVSETLTVNVLREGKGESILVAQGTIKEPASAQ